MARRSKCWLVRRVVNKPAAAYGLSLASAIFFNIPGRGNGFATITAPVTVAASAVAT